MRVYQLCFANHGLMRKGHAGLCQSGVTLASLANLARAAARSAHGRTCLLQPAVTQNGPGSSWIPASTIAGLYKFRQRNTPCFRQGDRFHASKTFVSPKGDKFSEGVSGKGEGGNWKGAGSGWARSGSASQEPAIKSSAAPENDQSDSGYQGAHGMVPSANIAQRVAQFPQDFG